MWCHDYVMSWLRDVMITWYHDFVMSWLRDVIITWCHIDKRSLEMYLYYFIYIGYYIFRLDISSRQANLHWTRTLVLQDRVPCTFVALSSYSPVSSITASLIISVIRPPVSWWLVNLRESAGISIPFRNHEKSAFGWASISMLILRILVSV